MAVIERACLVLGFFACSSVVLAEELAYRTCACINTPPGSYSAFVADDYNREIFGPPYSSLNECRRNLEIDIPDCRPIQVAGEPSLGEGELKTSTYPFNGYELGLVGGVSLNRRDSRAYCRSLGNGWGPVTVELWSDTFQSITSYSLSSPFFALFSSNFFAEMPEREISGFRSKGFWIEGSLDETIQRFTPPHRGAALATFENLPHRGPGWVATNFGPPTVDDETTLLSVVCGRR
jgi:hypothetical protein